MTKLFTHFKKFIHFVEIPCKTLFKSLCKSCEFFCEKPSLSLFPCAKLFLSTTFPKLSHQLFPHSFSPIIHPLIHLSTNPTITTTINIIN